MRQYASFFEWYEKGPKELGVVESLVGALSRAHGVYLHSPAEHTPDPPDCVATNARGELVAIEVAEVVCETAARRNAQGKDVYRYWNPGELSEHVERVVLGKDRKVFHGGPYAEVIACLFTDEPALSVEFAAQELTGRVFGPVAQLTSAYLLFSYRPATKSYPAIRLELVR